MIDLIGFWGLVTAFTLPFVYVSLAILYLVTKHLLYKVTEDEGIVRKFQGKTFFHEYPDAYFNKRIYFGKWGLRGVYWEPFIFIMSATVLSGICGILALVIPHGAEAPQYAGEFFFQPIIDLSVYLSPYVGGLLTLVGIYYGTIYLLRWIYRLGLKFNSLSETLKSHVADKEAHHD